jgi:plastocyanin
MRSAFTLAAALATIAATSAASAAEPDKSWQQGYQAAKEIADLKQEVKELREILQQLLELDRQRLELLTRALEKGAPPARVAVPAPLETEPGEPMKPVPPPAAPAAPPRKSRGTVSGRATIQGGVRAPIFVWIVDVRGKPQKSRSAKISQLDRQFSPRFEVVPVGTRIEFPNLDRIYHNVFSLSPGNRFDLGIYRSGDPVNGHVFNMPGLVEIYCNIHPEMSARVLVVPSELYTAVADDGSFTLAGVPPGIHQIAAWSPEAEIVEQRVEVDARGDATVRFELVQKKKAPHLNKNGQPYTAYP